SCGSVASRAAASRAVSCAAPSAAGAGTGASRATSGGRDPAVGGAWTAGAIEAPLAIGGNVTGRLRSPTVAGVRTGWIAYQMYPTPAPTRTMTTPTTAQMMEALLVCLADGAFACIIAAAASRA